MSGPKAPTSNNEEENSLRKPHPHSVNLLRNRNLDIPLGPFDGNVGAFAELGAKHYFITTNTDYVPALPSLKLPHAVYLRSDMRYGTDDPTLWPQQWTSDYCHMPLIPRRGAVSALDIMWWNPTQDDFQVGSAVTRGLGRLHRSQFAKFLPPITHLVAQCKELRSTNPKIASLPLFGELIQHMMMLVEQLETLPTTFVKMVFAVTSLQRAFLELHALYSYMTVYKPRMTNYLTTGSEKHVLAAVVGAFTTKPAVAQQLSAAKVPFWFIRPVEVFDNENILRVVALQEPRFDLLDPDAHGSGAPPILYSGNSTLEKIRAIQQAAVHTPWYRDPFETGFTRARSPSPAHGSGALTSSASHSQRYKPCMYTIMQRRMWLTVLATTDDAAKPSANMLVKQSVPKTQRDKFTPLDIPEMPPSISSMSNALTQVDRSIIPYTSSDADKKYVLPEPALLINTTPERRRKFLHHWNLLGDGFIYTLTQQPQLLRPQEWRDILEGLMTERGAHGSKTHKRSEKLVDCIRPALEASNISHLEGFPVPIECCPQLSLTRTHEIVWQVAETSFRFELCALDRRASGRARLNNVKRCFAGDMLVGVPLEMSQRGWAAPMLEDRHRYVASTAVLMLDWTTKSPRPRIIERIADRHQWTTDNMQELEAAVARHYTQAFWEYFGRAAVVPMRLEHDVGKEEGEL
ncbi:hypothetical protein B0H15DRAFT_791187 [Mycena belliarum]|uniref:Uncharacterized protein n=1 Tax=Mycena belliarum TaxID=1033014 RepID=A0AAD6XHZ1_9AGAR|nr:hypothetical protein B0H15DRAFT_791187 [Mycena belliae]